MFHAVTVNVVSPYKTPQILTYLLKVISYGSDKNINKFSQGDSVEDYESNDYCCVSRFITEKIMMNSIFYRLARKAIYNGFMIFSVSPALFLTGATSVASKDLRRTSQACPACGNSRLVSLTTVPYYKTHLVHWGSNLGLFRKIIPANYRRARFELHRCQTCDLIFVPESYKNLVELVEAHPLFAERVVEPYLNQTQPVIDSSIVSRVVTSPLRDLSPLEAVYKRLYRIISNYSRDISKYLDFGSNMGAFAEFVRIALPGRDISCCEINPYYVKKCKERYHQLRIIDKPLTSDVNQEKFDFIYCSDVIEHIWDLDELFRVLNSCLRDMGKLMLVTPDLNNKNAQKQGFWWWSFIVPHHSQFFNLSSMTALLTRFDLQIIEHGQIEEELFVVCQKKTAA